MSTSGLADRVRELVAHAATLYAGSPSAARLTATIGRMDGPLRVAVAGRVKAGKSTLLNALIGERVAATDAGECTRIVTWYAEGPNVAAWAFSRAGAVQDIPLRRDESGLTLDLGGLRLGAIERIRVELPSQRLAGLTLIDTPGIASLTEAAGQETHDFLLGRAGADGPADAVLYLLRQLHAADVNFVEAFRDLDYRGTTPVNALGVLSRADEIGGGASDALGQAAALAADYRADPRLRALVHTVVPIAGLLAETAATLSSDEWDGLASIAALPSRTTAPALLSARRLTSADNLGVSAVERALLLRRLGLYGLRLSIGLVRAGAAGNRDALAAALLDRSGLVDLRQLLLKQFTDRRDVLKADSAVRMVEAVLAADSSGGAVELRKHLERVKANSHELTELRLINELRSPASRVADDIRLDMERLLGAKGMDVHSRLGVPADASASSISERLMSEHARWQRVAVSSVSDPVDARAAATLQRTCESLLAQSRDGF